MSLIIDGTTIPTNGVVNFDGSPVEKVVCNGVTVWEKIVFTSKDFSYKGAIEEFVVPITGLYKLEAWGGEGGTARSDHATVAGGLGGHAVSYANLTKGTTLYICAGSKGGDTRLNHTGWDAYTKEDAAGARYNGGGPSGYGHHVDGVSYKEHYHVVANGGSCTHIAKRTGLLSSLESYKSDVLVVAGGAGGGAYNHEPKENGDKDQLQQSPGGAGGTGGDSGIFGTNTGYGQLGYGSGWSSGKFYLNGTNFRATGGTNMSNGSTYKGTAYSAVSESGINSGNGKAKITFITT